MSISSRLACFAYRQPSGLRHRRRLENRCQQRNHHHLHHTSNRLWGGGVGGGGFKTRNHDDKRCKQIACLRSSVFGAALLLNSPNNWSSPPKPMITSFPWPWKITEQKKTPQYNAIRLENTSLQNKQHTPSKISSFDVPNRISLALVPFKWIPSTGYKKYLRDLIDNSSRKKKAQTKTNKQKIYVVAGVGGVIRIGDTGIQRRLSSQHLQSDYTFLKLISVRHNIRVMLLTVGIGAIDNNCILTIIDVERQSIVDLTEHKQSERMTGNLLFVFANTNTWTW
jgi:hypothetical protein